MVVAAFCCMVSVVAQKSFGPLKYTHMCSYYGEDITGDITAFSAGPTAQKAIKKMMSVIGLKPNFELREANVPNAAAVMLNGKRFILYNPQFMDKINSASGTNWAAVSILAHEIGHHLNGHTLDNVGSRPQTELDADEFSGFVLHKMGACLTDAQAVMALISSPNGTKSHPPKRDRLAYIATGWNNAGTVSETAPAAVQRNDTPKTIASTPKRESIPVRQTAVDTPVRQIAVAKSSIAETTKNSGLRSSINASATSEVHFTGDPSGEYYLTKKGNLVQVIGTKVYMVASLYKSDRQGYSMMFADDANKKIYVAKGGQLIDSGGHKIGYMKTR